MSFPRGKFRWWRTTKSEVYRAETPKHKTDKPGRGSWWWVRPDGTVYAATKPQHKDDKPGRVDPTLHKAKNEYRGQKHYAASRNIPFFLTFDEWWEIWQASGHYSKRGGQQGNEFCMARGTAKFPDVGPYKVGNVRIITNAENRAEQDTSYMLGNTHALGSKHTEEWKREASVRNIGNTNAVGHRWTDKEKAQISERARKSWEQRRRKYGPSG